MVGIVGAAETAGMVETIDIDETVVGRAETADMVDGDNGMDKKNSIGIVEVQTADMVKRSRLAWLKRLVGVKPFYVDETVVGMAETGDIDVGDGAVEKRRSLNLFSFFILFYFSSSGGLVKIATLPRSDCVVYLTHSFRCNSRAGCWYHDFHGYNGWHVRNGWRG